MEIHLIRHTEVEVKANICYGQSDVSLSELGLEHLSQIKLPNHFDIVYASPLSRCAKIGDYFNIDYQIDERLLEFNFGSWELLSWENIPENESKQWYADYVNYRIPNGENVLDLKKRVSSFFEFLKQNHPNDTILLITHAGVIRMFMHLILQFPIENLFSVQPQCGKTTIFKGNSLYLNLEKFNL